MYATHLALHLDVSTYMLKVSAALKSKVLLEINNAGLRAINNGDFH